MKNHFLFLLLISFLVAACTSDQNGEDEPLRPEAGTWRATLQVSGDQLPFNFSINYKNESPLMIIKNGEETIEVSEITMSEDSIRIKLPVYDSEIRALVDNDTLQGQWHNLSKGQDYTMAFHAVNGQGYRFFPEEELKEPARDISGKWEATFSPGHPEEEDKAIGQFTQDGNQLSGTFNTPYGDKRFLKGVISGDSMYLSTFDGAFAYLFNGRIGDTLRGMYYSGKTHREPWIAVRNEAFSLPDPDEMTKMEDGVETLNFTFPDLDSNLVSLSDERFQDKVVVVEVMGSWCANCKDEARLLNDLYNEYHDLEVIALAYERTDNFEKEQPRVKKMVNNLNMPYTVLFAGKTGQVKQHLPIQSFNGYPTTFFLDRQGKVRKIHTAFSGPATGQAYEETVRAFRSTIEELLTEEGS